MFTLTGDSQVLIDHLRKCVLLYSAFQQFILTSVIEEIIWVMYSVNRVEYVQYDR